ncbi:hypothetical protein [Streptomyces virginiae]
MNVLVPPPHDSFEPIANRLIGRLSHCLQKDQGYAAALAFLAPPDQVGAAAAWPCSGDLGGQWCLTPVNLIAEGLVE